ncbi:hypothetical protein FRC19_011185, partial [Serendipita sp. 401]
MSLFMHFRYLTAEQSYNDCSSSLRKYVMLYDTTELKSKNIASNSCFGSPNVSILCLDHVAKQGFALDGGYPFPSSTTALIAPAVFGFNKPQ